MKPADKVSATEGDNAYFFLDILGDPVPQVTWFKVSGRVDIVDIKLQPPCVAALQGPVHGAKMQELDQRARPDHPRVLQGEAGRRGRVQSRDRERARDAGAHIQPVRHRGRRHGLQSHAHEEEETSQESRGGKFTSQHSKAAQIQNKDIYIFYV